MKIKNRIMKLHIFLLFILSYALFTIQVTTAQPQVQLNIRMLQAAKNDQADSVKYWLEKGADLNCTDSLQQSALHYLILKSQNSEILNFLLAKKINTNIRNSKGITPLMLAAFNGFTKCCFLLYKNGALLDLADNHGNTALDYAEANCNYEVIEFLKNPLQYSEKPDYIDYFWLAVENEEKKDFETAIKYSELAKKLSNVETCKNNLNFVLIRNRLATLYLQVGKSQEAILLLNDVIDISKKISNETNDFHFHKIYQGSLTLLAGTYLGNENYSQAEPLYREALEFSKELFGENHQDYVAALSNFSHYYMVMGNYSKAEPLYKKALKSLKELYGENHPDYITALSDLGFMYMQMGNYEKAEPLYEQALFASKEFFNKNSPDYVSNLYRLGHLYLLMENYSMAKLLLEEALSISNNLPERDFGSSVLQSLAFVFWKLKDNSQAEPLLEQSLKRKRENVFTTKHDFLRSFFNLAVINDEMKNYSKALIYFRYTFDELKDYTIKKFSFLSEKERESFWSINNGYSFVFPSFTFNFAQEPKSIALAYDNLLFEKGLLVNAAREIQLVILNSSDTTLVNAWNKMKSIRKRINFLELQPKEKQVNLPELEEEANQLDKELTQKSQAYRLAQSEQQIKWQDVQAKLKEGEAAIEFSSFSYYNKQWTDSTLYCALVLKKGMEYPVMVPLCEQKQLDSLWVGGKIAPNLLYASRGVTAEYKDQLPNGKRLYQLIWQPLEKELQDVKTVYYSPSGSLHQVSFAALPTDTSTYLCNKYNLVQLSSTRQLATAAWQAKPSPISSATLFGGIKYDLENQELAELQRSLPKNETNNSRGFTPDSTRSSIAFGFLKGTKDEVETISATLQAKSIKSTLYTGINGNEETFKALNNQNINVLHIATHGFFNPIEKENPQDLDRMMLMGEQRIRYSPNPLLRSGLILAGGNRTWKGEEPPAGMEDGILTAQEISEMDLHQTELVVLSACETGLGDVNGGEGVFGLQRAFKLAGVKTIIMSLWKVDDKATSEMMQLFYSKWLGGIDKHEAFRLAQQELKKKKNYSEPYYWAGFVMVD